MSQQLASEEYANKTIAWIKDLYAQSTQKHSGESLLSNLNENVQVNFNNHSGVRGKRDLEKLIQWQFDACTNIRYQVEDIRVFNDKIFIATTQTYKSKAGKEHALKVFTVIHKTPDQAKATRFDVYADTQGIFDHLKEHHGGRFAV